MIRGTRLGDSPDGRIREYHLDNSMRLRLSIKDIQLYGEAELLREHGVELGNRRVPVRVRGSRGSLSEPIGTLPADFDWRDFKPSLMVDLRPGDFTWVDDHWEASWTLCPGDFDAIPEFRKC